MNILNLVSHYHCMILSCFKLQLSLTMPGEGCHLILALYFHTTLDQLFILTDIKEYLQIMFFEKKKRIKKIHIMAVIKYANNDQGIYSILFYALTRI